MLWRDDLFREEDHPRGHPGNAGQFSRASEHGATGRTHESGKSLPGHIAKYRIPPAWRDVRYNDDPDAPLQVVGKDVKGREQRIYHPRYAASQAEAKFRRIQELDRQFIRIRAENADALRDPKRHDLAEVLSLIMETGIRPGSDDDTGAAKQAYGATTLEGRHVAEVRGAVRLRFVGKKGVNLDIPVNDKKLAAMLLARKKRAGDGRLFPNVNAGRLLSYVHSLDGGMFKTKDFRTLIGTRLAMSEMSGKPVPKDPKAYKKAVMDVAKQVATKLGNSPTIALQSYIAPEIFGSWRMAANA